MEMNHKEDIKKLIENNRLDEALHSLRKLFPDKVDDVLLINGRLNSLRQKRIRGSISEESAEIQFNQIREAILGFTDPGRPEDIRLKGTDLVKVIGDTNVVISKSKITGSTINTSKNGK